MECNNTYSTRPSACPLPADSNFVSHNTRVKLSASCFTRQLLVTFITGWHGACGISNAISSAWKTATGSWLQSVQPTFTHPLLLSSMVMRRWMAACLQAGEADVACSCGLLRVRHADMFLFHPSGSHLRARHLNGGGVVVGRFDWWRIRIIIVAAGKEDDKKGDMWPWQASLCIVSCSFVFQEGWNCFLCFCVSTKPSAQLFLIYAHVCVKDFKEAI